MEIENKTQLLDILQKRFDSNLNRHEGISWDSVLKKIDDAKIKVLIKMENSGGEPDVIGARNDEYIFCDCSPESPLGRRSFCYDRKALDSRKANKPMDSAVDFANSIGVDILTEEEYRELQKLGEFDKKTSSWIKTPDDIRDLGGAIFCDRRYNKVFTYHNGADSYYSARGFRGIVMV